VNDSLFALEVDPESGQEAYRRVVETLVGAFHDAGLRLADDDLDRLFETGLIPGGDEVAALEYIARYTWSGYDNVVFDTAPTGHTLRLLDLPEVLGETLGVASEVRRRVRQTTRAARSMVFGPAAYMGNRDEPDEIASLRERIGAVSGLLRDPAYTRFRVVLTPERMAIAETERLVSRLADASIPVDSLVVNRCFENESECPCDRCQRDAERHATRLREVSERFDRPVVRLPELPTESQGFDALSELGPPLVTAGRGSETTDGG
jgi:arsenite-transporting ATPase